MPGEMWTTFPDLQFGVIDASRNAQKLIAVRYFSTSANYATGDFVVQAGALYAAKGAITAGAFNATQWTKLLVAADVPAALPIASTTVLGAVKVDGTSITASGSGVLTVPSTAVQAMNDNRVLNGDMRIDQRNGGASGTAAGYTTDRWQFASNFATKGTWGQNLNNAAPASAFPYYLGWQSNSSYTSAASDYFLLQQSIEADMVSDFAWGTPSAQPVTLSFWAQSNLGGSLGGSIGHPASTRSYPFTYSLPGTATWTKVVIAIPGDTAGTWVMKGNAAAVLVNFDLGSGSNFHNAPNAWASGNYVGVPVENSIAANQYGFLYITGVKLEIGSVATPFNRQSLAKSMADCQRYYQSSQIAYQGYATTLSGVYVSVNNLVQMRANPTLVIATNNCGNITSPSLTGSTPAGSSVTLLGSVVSTAIYTLNVTYTASAEL